MSLGLDPGTEVGLPHLSPGANGGMSPPARYRGHVGSTAVSRVPRAGSQHGQVRNRRQGRTSVRLVSGRVWSCCGGCTGR